MDAVQRWLVVSKQDSAQDSSRLDFEELVMHDAVRLWAWKQIVSPAGVERNPLEQHKRYIINFGVNHVNRSTVLVDLLCFYPFSGLGMYPCWGRNLFA